MILRTILIGICLAALLLCASSQTSSTTSISIPQRSPSVQIVGHRGAPYYVPEHTLASYEIAMRQGVDWIEPDLCITKDGQLVIVHDLELGSVTDISERPEFAGLNRSVTMPNGRVFSGWIVSDFTLAQIKTLKVKQRVTFRGTLFDGLWQVPTLDEALQLLQDTNKILNRTIGAYIETKHPAYFASVGLKHDDALLRSLNKFGYVIEGSEAQKSKIIIQSFESTNLKRLRTRVDLPLVQLIDLGFPTAEDTQEFYWKMMTADGLKKISAYANGIGPAKDYFIPDAYKANPKYIQDATLLLGKSLIDEAHKNKLVVHPYTFRNPYEDKTLVQFNNDVISEYLYFLDIGVDGYFTEWAGEAVCAGRVHELLKSLGPSSSTGVKLPATVPTWALLVAFFVGILIMVIIIAIPKLLSATPAENSPAPVSLRSDSVIVPLNGKKGKRGSRGANASRSSSDSK